LRPGWNECRGGNEQNERERSDEPHQQATREPHAEGSLPDVHNVNRSDDGNASKLRSTIT
jgi:hypothetical protein